LLTSVGLDLSVCRKTAEARLQRNRTMRASCRETMPNIWPVSRECISRLSANCRVLQVHTGQSWVSSGISQQNSKRFDNDLAASVTHSTILLRGRRTFHLRRFPLWTVPRPDIFPAQFRRPRTSPCLQRETEYIYE